MKEQHTISVCVVSTVHPALDHRIFHKEAISLKKAGYPLTVIAQHHKKESIEGIQILPLRRPGNRFFRFLFLGYKAYKLALKQRAAIYHFHDPEFLPWSVMLKARCGANIIYDIHEFVAGQILHKTWIPQFLRKPFSFLYQCFEKFFLSKVDVLLLAEHSYTAVYAKHKKSIVIRNYPRIPQEEHARAKPLSMKPPHLIYVGWVAKERGIFEILEATRIAAQKFPHIELTVIGRIHEDLLETINEMLGKRKLKDHVTILGHLPHPDAISKIRSANIGLCILHPIPNYLGSISTKIFEYMSYGIPIIISNFPSWKKIIEASGAGFAVDPKNPGGIAQSIDYLITHPHEAWEMGERGRKAVLKNYNWEREEKKLLHVYSALEETKQPPITE